MAIFKKKAKSRASQISEPPQNGTGEFVSPSSSLAKGSISSINSVSKSSFERPPMGSAPHSFNSFHGEQQQQQGQQQLRGNGNITPNGRDAMQLNGKMGGPGAPLPGLNSPFKPGSSMGFTPGTPNAPSPKLGRESVNEQYAAGAMPHPDMRSPAVMPPSPPSQQRNMSSPFPWTRTSLLRDCPFPRYGHASNPTAARDGEVFVMGGLKGSNVFGDLWVIESDTLNCYQLSTDGCPSPRVGHAALTLGNAFIVFGGDTKIEEHDELDDNLYLLNTTTLKWTVASSSGPRPSGRYGHTISTVGSKVYVFGGQLDDFFFDDLLCYDLTMLRNPNAQWELVSIKGKDVPPPRTNHSMVTYQDKLYLFGGTDGKLWYSDTWCFDPVTNQWTNIDCTGYLPAPCEGHSATIVGDFMYVFGGRSSQGKDLGTLSALKLSARKWYTFQNLGPGPSPRSGHSMTAFGGDKILVMGGESPSDAPPSPGEGNKNNTVFVLDTTRINYPPAPEEELSATAMIHGKSRNVSPYDAAMREESSRMSNASDLRAISPQGSLAHHIPLMAPHNEGDEKSSNATFESADEGQSRAERDMTPETVHSGKGEARIPGGWQQQDNDSLYDDATLRQADSPKIAPRDEVKNMAEAIERLKVSNSWYESQLATAKENGYLAEDAPVDILKMRRVSQIATQDNSRSLSERDLLLAALSELKDEFQKAQTDLKERAREASERITAVERARDELADENERLREELETRPVEQEVPANLAEVQKQLLEERNSKHVLVQQLEKLEQLDHYKSQNAIMEQELRRYADKQVLLDHEVSQLKSKLDTSTARVESLTSSADHQVTALAASGAAVVAAEKRVAELSKQVDEYRSKCSELTTHVDVLGRQVSDYESNEKRLRQELNEQKTILDYATTEAEQASKSMSGGIEQIVALWAGLSDKKKGTLSDSVSVITIEDDDEEDPQLIELQNKVKEVSEQMNIHKTAAEKMTEELKVTVGELQAVRRELINSEEARRETELKIATSQHELQSSNETYQHKLTEHESTLEQHKALQDECKQLEAKCAELEQENEQSMQILRNTDKALSRSKEDVVKYRELSSKLEEEVKELRLLREHHDSDGKEDGDSVTSRRGSSAGIGSNRQFDLQMRDLRAQVMLLQQERDELHSDLMEYKKKVITNRQDYEEAKEEMTRLTRENNKLEQRLATLLNTSSVDPVSGQSLEEYADELNKVNEGRERRSGILRDA